MIEFITVPHPMVEFITVPHPMIEFITVPHPMVEFIYYLFYFYFTFIYTGGTFKNKFLLKMVGLFPEGK